MMPTISMQDQEQKTLSFPCKRNHRIFDQQYTVTIIDGALLIGKTSKTPKYTLPLNLDQMLYWYLHTSKIRGFGLRYKEKIKFFEADHECLQALRTRVSNKIMFDNIRNFYTPISILGSGAMANVNSVYLVRNNFNENELFAAKCISKDKIDEDELLSRLLQHEIEILRSLNHPNIIKIHECFGGDKSIYLILEYMQGQSLDKLLLSKIPHENCQIILEQILRGVQYLHSQEIIHRDLKPENIMFKVENDLQTLKIVDFGLATSKNKENYSLLMCGTPGYVAPEILKLKQTNKKYDEKCDLYSIGSIMYKMYTGQSLFKAKNTADIIKLNKKSIVEYEFLDMHNVPDDAVNLLKSLLDPNPVTRITTEEALCHPYFAEKSILNSSWSCRKNVTKSVIKTQTWSPVVYDFNKDVNIDEGLVVNNEHFEEKIRVPYFSRGISLQEISLKSLNFSNNSFVTKADIYRVKKNQEKQQIKKQATNEFEYIKEDQPSLMNDFYFS